MNTIHPSDWRLDAHAELGQAVTIWTAVDSDGKRWHCILRGRVEVITTDSLTEAVEVWKKELAHGNSWGR